MTRAPEVSRLCFEDFADAVDVLRRRGLRLSAPRRRVLAALFAAEDPRSVERLARDSSSTWPLVYEPHVHARTSWACAAVRLGG